MIKRLLNCLSLTRIILVLLVTILPQSLWAADDNYGIIVAGIPINSSNASDVLGDGNGGTGSVSFDQNTNTLTLNGAIIDMQGIIDHYAIESSINGLNVKLLGYSSITIGGNSDRPNVLAYTGESNAAQLTLETEANAEGSFGKLNVSGISDKEYITKDYTITNQLQNSDSGEQTGWKYTEQSGTFPSVDITYIEYYDLWIGGAHINSDNLMPVSGGTKYIPSTHTLHLAGYGYSDAISSKMQELIVEVEGNNSLSSFSYTGTENGRIVFRTADNSQLTNTVNLQSNDGGVITGFYQVVIEEPLQLNSPGTISDLSTASSAIISNNIVEYSLRIAGVQVNDKNASSGITGEGITGTIKYDNDKHTLTLNNATITMGNGSEPDAPTMEVPCIEYSDTDPLTISIIGNNIIESNNGVPPLCQYNEIRPAIIFQKGDSAPCSLRISSPGETVIDGFKSIQGVNGVNNEDGHDLVAIADDELEIDEENGLHYKSLQDHVESLVIADDYRLKVNGVAVSSYNASDVLSEDSQNKGKISFKQENGNSILTLNNAKINSDGIVSSVEELTIDLIGKSETAGSIRAQGDNCRLIFTSAQENRGAAKLNFWYSVDTPISGFSEGNVVYNSGLCLRDDATNSSCPKVVALFIPHVEINEPEHGLYFPDHEFKMTQKEEAEGFDLYYANMIGASTPNKTENGTFKLAASDNSYAIRCYAVYPGGNIEASWNYQFASHFYPKVITKPAFTLSTEEIYNEPQQVSITGLTQNTRKEYISDFDGEIQVPQIWYYLNDNKTDSIRYNDETPITVSESTKISFYVIDGDSGKKIKSDIVEAQYVIRQNPGVSFTAETAQYTIGAADNPAFPTLQDATDLKVAYSSNNENVATINESGEVTVIGVGEATISATTAQTDTYLSQTVSYTLTVYKNLTHSSITATITDATYTGEALTPAVTIMDGDANLKQAITSDESGDYTASYSNNTYVATSTDEKAPTATITGKGYYVGTLSLTFSIIAKSLEEATITLSETEYTYDGDAKKPSVTIKFESDGATGSSGAIGSVTTLTEGTDYDVTYKKVIGKNEEDIAANQIITAGTYKAIATAKGNYTGTKEAIFTIAKASTTPTVTIEGWTYGSTANAPSIFGNTGNGSVSYEYKLQNAEESKYSTVVPTEAGDYTIKATIAATANYEAAVDSTHFAISKATPSITFDEETYSATFGETFTTPTASTSSEELTVVATSSSNTQVATVADGIINIIGIGETIITVSFAGNNNYEAATATYLLNVAAGTNKGVIATGYTGIYDGKAHGITVSAPEGATVKFGKQKGTYNLTESPTYTNAGIYKVHYQVTMDNYNTITDSATVEISKADITPTVTLEGWTYGTTANTPIISGNAGNGTVTYTYKTEGAETFTETMPEVVGTHTIKASIAETTNYNAGEATSTFTITAATITVTAEGYKGTYDNKAHGITVSSPEGATVKFGTQKGTYNLTESPTYTNAGIYKVHYQVTMDNYNTVTDSVTVEINKAAGGLEYSTATASAELNSDGWTAPELKNPNSLTVTYTSSNTAVATISETGVVTLVGAGETTIKAASEGDTNHEACETQYVLTVSPGRTLGYGVWVGETEVDEDNCEDILNDGEKDNDGEYTKIPSFIFNPDENTLLIINSDAGLTIESRIPELKIHLSNDNKLKKIFYNNQGKSENTGTLLFTCDSNFPGSVTIGNTVGESAISGFTSVSYEFSLQALKPAKAKYTNGQMTDSLGVVADTITVGTPLKPIQNNDKEELDADDFTVTNPDGSSATLDLTSANVNDIYYTLPESTEGQGYDPETNSINVIDPMTDDAVDQIAAATTNKNTTVGSSDYAENFIGVTFIVQGGEGVIRIDQETEEGYEFHLKIGDKPSIALKSGKEEITYSLPDATYCWLYLVRNAALARGGTRVNKRDHTPGNIRLIKVQSKTVASTKSAKAASGGAISPKANNTITGIVDINKDTPESKYNVETVNDKWYTIDGRRIDKPTKKGLYIRNRKKVVVK